MSTDEKIIKNRVRLLKLAEMHSNKERRLRLGVQRIEDPHHPRGYRELRSPAEIRKLLNRKISEQGGKVVLLANLDGYELRDAPGIP